jgi:hypothetical protein
LLKKASVGNPEGYPDEDRDGNPEGSPEENPEVLVVVTVVAGIWLACSICIGIISPSWAPNDPSVLKFSLLGNNGVTISSAGFFEPDFSSLISHRIVALVFCCSFMCCFIIDNTEMISSLEIMIGALADIPDPCIPNTGVGPLLVGLLIFF